MIKKFIKEKENLNLNRLGNIVIIKFYLGLDKDKKF